MMDVFTWSETCCNQPFRHIKSGYDWWLLSLRLVTIRVCITRFDNKRFYLLPTKRIYVFCMELNTNSDIKLYNIKWKLDTSESRSEIPVKFWNSVLEKDGKVRWDRSCEKLSITEIYWRKYRIEGAGRWRRRHEQLLHELKERRSYWKLIEKTLDRLL